MRKKSSYKPRPVRADNMGWLLAGFERVKDNPLSVHLRIKTHDAMEQLRTGNGTFYHAELVMQTLNMADALRQLGIGADYEDEINAAQRAMVSLGQRGLRSGRWLMTGQELTALNLAYEIHDAQLDVATHDDLEAGIAIIKRSLATKDFVRIEV